MRKIVCLLTICSLFCCMNVAKTSVHAQEPVRYLQEVFQENQLTTNTNLVYKTVEITEDESIDLKLDITYPNNDTLTQRPLLVWIHGGGFVSGTKEVMTRRCIDFAKMGYVTCTIQYRLAKDHVLGDTFQDVVEGAVDDTRSAIDWLLENASEYKIDPTTVLVGGSSAGAVTSCHVAYDDREWDNKKVLKGIVSLWGGLLPTNMEEGKTGELDYDVQVQENECPACLIHGAKDPIVPVQLAYDLANKLEAVGIPCTMKIDPTAGHGVKPDTARSYHSVEPLFLFVCMN